MAKPAKKLTAAIPFLYSMEAPLSAETEFEELEFIRFGLLENLELTTDLESLDGKARRDVVAKIKKIAERLIDVSLLRHAAAVRAINDGRIEYGWQAEERGEVVTGAPHVDWDKARNYWRAALKDIPSRKKRRSAR